MNNMNSINIILVVFFFVTIFYVYPIQAWNKMNIFFESVRVTKQKFGKATKELTIYEKTNLCEMGNNHRQEKEPIIFLTGLNSYISHQYYSIFLKSLAKFPVSIYIINQQQSDDFEFYVKQIFHMHSNKTISIVAHSSGSQSALLYAKNKYIKNLILFDPVNDKVNKQILEWSNVLSHFRKDDLGKNSIQNTWKPEWWKEQKESSTTYNHVKNILIIDMEKSHTITFNPVSFPFIPSVLALSVNDLKPFSKTSNIKRFYVKEFGHCDILDDFYGDLMQITRLAVGTNEKVKRVNYRNDMAKLVFCGITEQEFQLPLAQILPM